ncbi:Retrovirus-related Pol polyprotein from transposon [Ceratobasidium sp. AG-Ba]|nr:Retrovirus-related Pol polyprotein from transposon [Ceratobasidium sp. AG-Ba]
MLAFHIHILSTIIVKSPRDLSTVVTKTRPYKTSKKRKPPPRGEDGRFKTKTKATTATTLLSTPQSNPWPTPAQLALLSSPVRAPGAYPFAESSTSPSPARTLPFPSDSPFEVLPDLPPEPSPVRTRRSVTPSTPPHFSSQFDSSPEAVEQALDDELQFDDEPTLEYQFEPPAEDHEDHTVTVPSTINPSTATVQPVVVPTQVPSQMSNPDMKLVHQRLGDLRRFNDNRDPMTEAEYRERFINITDGVADDIRAKLWASKLAYQGAAWWWHQLKSEDPNTSADMKLWSKLVLEIEKRWLTPVLNKSAYVRATQEAFWNHKLIISDIADSLINNDTVSLPHQVWASEHYAKGMACDSTNVDRVSYTLRHCVEFTVIQLLPKRHDYDDDFAGLCKDIGQINPLSLYHTWKTRDDVDKLLANSFTGLAVTPQAPVATTPSYHGYYAYGAPTTQPPAQPRVAPPSVAGTMVAQHQRPASALPKPTPQIYRTPATPRHQLSKDQPPHFPALPAVPMTPSHTPAQPARPGKSITILEQGPPPISSEFIEKLRAIQNPNAVMPNLVATDTPENHAVYRASVLQFKQDHGDRGPWLTRPYPLSPGTFKQTLDLCTVCARGSHPPHKCPAETKGESVPRHEQVYCSMLVSELRRAAKKTRAGVQWNTPTPAQRVKDVQHVDFGDDLGPEEEWEQYDGYESGNEGGRRA